MSGASAPRLVVRALVDEGLSTARACAAVDISRSSYFYEFRRGDDVELIERMGDPRQEASVGLQAGVRQAQERGFHCESLEGRAHRAQAGFTLPARRKRKKIRTGDIVPVTAGHPINVWTYDFMFDATHQGRRMKVLTVIDEFTREALAVVPARLLTASSLKGVLTRLFADRGLPERIRSDTGAEFIALELTEWLEAQGSQTHLVEPASLGRTASPSHSTTGSKAGART